MRRRCSCPVGRKSSTVEIAEISAHVLRKGIKHLYIRVDPADGQVRVSAPVGMSEQSVRRAIAERLEWIRARRRAAMLGSSALHRFTTGEIHEFQGAAYRLNVTEHDGRPGVRLAGGAILEMRVKPDSDLAKRRSLLESWYRRRLRAEIPELIRRWEPVIGVRVAEWRIKRMKTRWGTCNTSARRIWMNLELARKPRPCLEYVLVHEMVHLLERRHNERFRAHMDRLMPDWRTYRNELNRRPGNELAAVS